MKWNLKKSLCLLSGMLTLSILIATPILVSNFSKHNTYTNNINWLKMDNNDVIFIDNPNFVTNIDDIVVYDKISNIIIPINKHWSKINSNGIYIVLENLNNTISSLKIQNIVDNKSLFISQNDIITFSQYDLLSDQKYFYDFIKDSCNNGIPTIGFIRNASLISQQAFYIGLINYYNNYNESSLLDSTYWFGWNELWSQNKINFDVLINNNIIDGNFEFSYEFEPKNFNIFKSNDMYSDNEFNTDKIIEYFSLILKKNNVDKFDFVTDEIHFLKMFKNFDQNFFNFIFKHANRILIMSDGANHTNDTVPYLSNILRNHKPISREETINMLDEFISGKRTNLSKEDILNLLLLKNYEQINPNSQFNFIQFINYDANIFNTLNLKDSVRWNESAFSTNFITYQDIITNSENKEKYLKIFTSLFLDIDVSLENIFVNGVSEYDPSKKNAIFIGSSLFKPISGEVTPDNFSRLENMPDVLNEVQTTFLKFLKKYPPDKYNIIFKLHPVFSNKDDVEHLAAINYVKQISNNMISNPIIVNSSIPLESWIAFDYYNYFANNKETPSILFKSSEPETWTTFFGFQATSTTIQTTRIFYQTAFNIDKYRVSELIPFYNFPIPKLFPVVKRLDSNNSSYNYEFENIQQIRKIYDPYCPSIHFDLPILEKYDSIILNLEQN